MTFDTRTGEYNAFEMTKEGKQPLSEGELSSAAQEARSLFASVMAEFPFQKNKRKRIETVLVDLDATPGDEFYISMKDAAKITGLSPERLRGLASEGRLNSIRPSGHDLFVSLDSVRSYMEEGRMSPGRPRKTSP